MMYPEGIVLHRYQTVGNYCLMMWFPELMRKLHMRPLISRLQLTIDLNIYPCVIECARHAVSQAVSQASSKQ